MNEKRQRLKDAPQLRTRDIQPLRLLCAQAQEHGIKFAPKFPQRDIPTHTHTEQEGDASLPEQRDTALDDAFLQLEFRNAIR